MSCTEKIDELIKPKCYIDSITFNNGEELDVKPNDIVVFVGPNNVGKSQALKDIFNKTSVQVQTTVIKDLHYEIESERVKQYIISISKPVNTGAHLHYQGLMYKIYYGAITGDLSNYLPDSIRDFFVAYLSTINRLTICEPPQSIPRDETPQHPIHYAAVHKDAKEWLSSNYCRAFGEHITPNTQFGSKTPLCIGPRMKVNPSIEDMEDQIDYYAQKLASYKQVQYQGDGIKSFTGILLYLMVDRYSSFLIDEPESFLHPPQARIMGEIIAETLSNTQQAFISTHSEEIVKGLLVKAPDRVKVVRVTREGDINSFSVLRNDEIAYLWRDPLLRHSNIFSSLFHKTVILCESDSDCQMYSLIDEYLEGLRDRYTERLYIHCGGKQRVAVVVKALKSVNVDVRAIIDLDVLNDRHVFSKIVEAFNGDWQNYEKDYKMLENQLHAPKDHVTRVGFQSELLEILSRGSNEILDKDELKAISELTKTPSKWDALKNFGFAGAPPGDGTLALERISSSLKELGIYLVPVGELENFVKSVGDHGPSWVAKVLESYPDFSVDIYNGIRNFMSEVIAEK